MIFPPDVPLLQKKALIRILLMPIVFKCHPVKCREVKRYELKCTFHCLGMSSSSCYGGLVSVYRRDKSAQKAAVIQWCSLLSVAVCFVKCFEYSIHKKLK